ncbi:oligopeptide/dipeptide ABC transporter ATP-binding protein [Aeromicrobium choanae]|uniref:Peptide/nickel transport system ATP-binding protein n=1 Tax=Aeromicrobium choanae TaxID=1736691 RepID=A0A1T4YX73_9ACTN|nr:ABC transporter ATP-binding protein [Aeromicrobium choanae]SKB06384.1 peptide/nickel transport system ATP-binding protein [Aeromicrobium choanae]
MLEVENLRIRYPGRDRPTVIEDVSFAIAPGGALGLVGESGSGKSTIAKAIVGLAPVTGGSIAVDGSPIDHARARSRRALHDRVQLVFQDPRASLNPRRSVGDAVADAFVGGATISTSVERGRRLAELLEQVGLPASFAERFPSELSGGQAQRVAIARALGRRPRLLLLDEVTASLDVSVQASILNLLRDLRDELGLTYLVIAHDLAIVRYLCDHAMVLQAGVVLERAAVAELFDEPRHPYTKVLIDSVPEMESPDGRELALVTGDPPDPAHRPSGCVFTSRCPIGPLHRVGREICLSDRPPLSPQGDAEVACHFPITHSAGAREVFDAPRTVST